jgi:adenylate kinase family enzyme
MIKRINFFGGPGSGKTTTAAWLFSELKTKGHSIHLVNEYVKNDAYLKKKPSGMDQLFIFSNQINNEDIPLRSGIQSIITDSPILLSVFYSKELGFDYWKEELEIVKKYEKKYLSLNILLKRNDIKYETIGRYENEEESIARDVALKQFLNNRILDKTIDYYYEVNTKDRDKIIGLIQCQLSP